MKRSDRWINMVLLLLVASLLAVCAMSIAGQMDKNGKNTDTEYARNNN